MRVGLCARVDTRELTFETVMRLGSIGKVRGKETNIGALPLALNQMMKLGEEPRCTRLKSSNA